MKRHFLPSFYSFLSGPGKNVLFTALFYTLWLATSVVLDQSFKLESFPQRMIGTATFDAYDVSARVSLFYKAVLVLFVAFFTLNLLAYFIYLKRESLVFSTEAQLVNYSSLLGLIFLLFQVFDYKVTYTMELVYYCHKLMVLALFLRFVFFRKSRLDLYAYSFIVLASFFLYFFVADLLELSGSSTNPDFYILTFILSALLLISIMWLSHNEDDQDQFSLLLRFYYVALPLSFLPIISVAKDELYFIFRNNGIQFTNALIPLLGLIFLLTLGMFYRNHSFKKAPHTSLNTLIVFRYFPLFVFSLFTYTYYSHYFNYTGESFESANKYLAIMEYKLFGVIPTLEKFNSHLLSDYFFSAIYTFLNGMGSGNDIELYDFLFIPFSFTLYYFLLYFITGNAFISLFTVLLFPFSNSMLSGGYSFSIPGIFALFIILTRRQSIKNYLLLFFCILGMVLWRFDLGYSCMLITPLILLLYHFLCKDFKIHWSVLFKALVLVFVSVLVLLGALSIYRQVNLFEKSLYILNYFASSQTYGYTTIGWETMPAYKMHYFIFPVLVCLLILALILKFKSLNVSISQRLSYLSLLFICIYYIVNFNRGLVRHSLIEWTDDFTASFIYIILSSCVFVFFYKHDLVLKYILFVTIAFFSILSFKLPVTKGSLSVMESGLHKVQNTQHEALSKIVQRTKGIPSLETNPDKDFYDFIANNTLEKETFIDFTGSSLLYYYTKKITPSYFFQNPLCNHNEFLQKHFIEDLSTYDVPYLLFSSVNDNDYDVVDGVPNTLRNYRMAEYFYRNYEPHLVLGHLRVWKKKGRTDKSKTDTLFHYINIQNNIQTPKQLSSIIRFKKNKKYLLRVTKKSESEQNVKLVYKKDSLQPLYYKAANALYYCIIDTKLPKCDLVIFPSKDSTFSCTVLECDYLPDFYSEKFLSYDFKKLPYIWGTYDKELSKEPVLFDMKIHALVKKDFPYSLTIPSNLDKSSGNTIILSCRNNSKKSQILRLSFGSKHNTNRSVISFLVLPSDKEERYAVRVSSVYKWFSPELDQVNLSNETDRSISVSSIKITKGI